MAFALAERFHLYPKAFVSDTPRLSGKPRLQVHITRGKLERMRKAGMAYKILERSTSEVFVYVGDFHPMRDDQKLVASSKKVPAKPRPAKG